MIASASTPETETKSAQPKVRRCIVVERLVKITNLKSLESFGEVVYLMKDGDNRPSVFDQRFSEVVADKLSEVNFDPESDYIAIAGSYNTVAHLVAVAVNLHGYCRALLYSNSRGKFVTTQIG